LCAERQCRAAEKRRKKKENDTAIEAEVQCYFATQGHSMMNLRNALLV